ncbi:hypothetical protein TNCV_1712191 [Trichonephila clavipes]|nr:hypothetical protein TNCV_1712191 [Trichonephila clavipes]
MNINEDGTRSHIRFKETAPKLCFLHNTSSPVRKSTGHLETGKSKFITRKSGQVQFIRALQGPMDKPALLHSEKIVELAKADFYAWINLTSQRIQYKASDRSSLVVMVTNSWPACRGADFGFQSGHGSLVVKIMDSCLAGHMFELSAAEDPPCRGCRCTFNLSRLKHPPQWRNVHPGIADIIKMGRTILLERRQSESVGRRNSRTTFLRSDWPRPFARREVGVEMELGRSENKRPEQRRS